MPRRRAATDKNHAVVTRALSLLNFSVVSTHQLGGGVPDALVGGYDRGAGGHADRWVEIKDPSTRHGITPDEAEFARTWRGAEIIVAYSPYAVLRAYGHDHADAYEEALNALVAASFDVRRSNKYYNLRDEPARELIDADLTTAV